MVCDISNERCLYLVYSYILVVRIHGLLSHSDILDWEYRSESKILLRKMVNIGFQVINTLSGNFRLEL